MSSESEPLYRHSRMQVIFGITLMGVMAVSLISPALPNIRIFFGVSTEEVGLLITAFTLPGIFVSFFIGTLTDRFGRLQVLTPLLILFGVSGGACAVSRTFSTLLFLRFLQGIGGAGLVTISTTLIGDYYDGLQRAAAMGANASVLEIGVASYYFLGGILASFSWSVPFLLFPLAIPLGFVALYKLENPEIKGTPLRKYLSRIKKILLDPRAAAGMVAAALAFVMLYGGVLTYFSQLGSRQFGLTSINLGLLTGMMALVTALVSSQIGKLVKRFSKVPLIVAGFVGYGMALLLIPVVPTAWLFFAPMVLFGFSHGLVLPNLQTHFSELAPTDFRGATMSLFNISTRLGMTVGPSFLGLIYAFGNRFLFVFISAGLLSIVTAVVAMIMIQSGFYSGG